MGSGEIVGKVFFCFCGPKGSMCCTILSIWGFLMLLFLGISCQLQAVALYEDIESRINTTDPDSDHLLPSEDVQEYVDTAYQNAALACYIAATLYLAYLIFSAIMIGVNVMRKRAIKSYKQS